MRFSASRRRREPLSLHYLACSGNINAVERDLKVRVFGEGIKEPSIYQQARALNDTLATLSNGSSLIAQFGVKQVGAENSRTFDGGIDREFASGRGKVGATYFYNHFTNGVEFVPEQGLVAFGVPSNVAQAALFGAYVNSLAVLARGLETEVTYRIGKDLAVRAGYTYLDAVVQRSFSSDALSPTFNPAFPTIAIGAYSPLVGARPFRRAPNSGYFAVSYLVRDGLVRSPEHSLGNVMTATSFDDKDGNPTLLMPNHDLDASYQRLDASGSYQVNRFATIYTCGAKHLSASTTVRSFGYPALPSAFRSGVKLSWGGESWK